MSFDQQSLRLFCRTLNVWSVNQKDVNVRLASQKGDQFSFPCLLIWIAAITWARLFCCSAIHLVLKTSKDAHNKSWSPWICLNEPRGEYLRLWMIWFVQMTNNERFCSERFLFAETNLNAFKSISCGWAFVNTEREPIYFFVSSKRRIVSIVSMKSCWIQERVEYTLCSSPLVADAGRRGASDVAIKAESCSAAFSCCCWRCRLRTVTRQVTQSCHGLGKESTKDGSFMVPLLVCPFLKYFTAPWPKTHDSPDAVWKISVGSRPQEICHHVQVHNIRRKAAAFIYLFCCWSLLLLSFSLAISSCLLLAHPPPLSDCLGHRRQISRMLCTCVLMYSDSILRFMFVYVCCLRVRACVRTCVCVCVFVCATHTTCVLLYIFSISTAEDRYS